MTKKNPLEIPSLSFPKKNWDFHNKNKKHDNK